MDGCVVPNCFTKKDEESLYLIPKNPVLNSIWRRLIYRPEKNNWSEAKVCIKHFSKNDIFYHNGNPCLIDKTFPIMNIVGENYRESIMRCINSKVSVILRDCSKKAAPKKATPNVVAIYQPLITNVRCCLCIQFTLKGKRTRVLTGNRWTAFGKKMLYFVESLKSSQPISCFVCEDCFNTVEDIFTENVGLQERFLTTVRREHDCDNRKCYSCDKLTRSMKCSTEHFGNHLVESVFNDPPHTQTNVTPARSILKKTANNMQLVLYNRAESETPAVQRAKKLVEDISMMNFDEESQPNDEFQKQASKTRKRRSLRGIPKVSNTKQPRLEDSQALVLYRRPQSPDGVECCTCGEMIYENRVNCQKRDDEPDDRFPRIFDLIIYAPESKTSNFTCLSCKKRILNIFKKFLAVNVQFMLTCRRLNGQTLQTAVGNGCFKADCDYIARNENDLAVHMVDHY